MKKYMKSSLSRAFSALCLLVIFFVAAHTVVADTISVYSPFVDITSAPGWATFSSSYDPPDQEVTTYFEFKKGNAAVYTQTPKKTSSDGYFDATVGFTTAPGNYLFHAVVVGADNVPIVNLGGDIPFTIASSQTTTNGSDTPIGSGQNPDTDTPIGSGSHPTTTPTDTQTNTNGQQLNNPLAGVNTIPDFIAKLLNIMLKIAVPILVCAFIYCGFLFVKAQGKEKELEHAKSALLYTVIGAALVLGAWTLANAISGTINQLK
jgi:hypothetical protein